MKEKIIKQNNRIKKGKHKTKRAIGKIKGERAHSREK